jgi:hypothetical protein
MRKQFINPFNNSRLKAIIFFLLLATVFWVLTKFSRQYTATAVATIRYLNIPELNQVKDNTLKVINFIQTASGFQFLYYKFRRPIVEIDLDNFYIDGKREIFIPKFELTGIFSSQLKADITIRGLRNDQLIVGLDAIISKKVAIKANTNFTFKDGFRSLGSLSIKPDSVVVSGPASYLNGINFLSTNLLSIEDLDKSFSQIVSLVSIDNAKISIAPLEVNAALNVAEFTQKTVIVPIELINVPQQTIVKLIPKAVTVTFNVSVTDFNKITANDFKLVCDFHSRDLDEDFIFLTKEEFPAGIYNIELSTNKIDYLIFK